MSKNKINKKLSEIINNSTQDFENKRTKFNNPEKKEDINLILFNQLQNSLSEFTKFSNYTVNLSEKKDILKKKKK